MARCIKCGKWAGLGSHEHSECVTKPIMYSGNSDLDALRPLLLEAAAKAGRTAAFTFIWMMALIGFALGALYALFQATRMPTR